MKRRVAIFYHSRTPNSDTFLVSPDNAMGHAGYVRAELTPPGTTLLRGLDLAKPRKGESVMNAHYID